MYLLCRTNKHSVTASSSTEEGRICNPLTSSSSGLEVVPGLGAHRRGSSCYRQANACNSTDERERKEKGSLTRVCSCSTDEE